MVSESSFSQLSHDEQIAAIEQLGRGALMQFGVEPQTLTPLVHAENTTFKVESEAGTFCLRIHRPGYQHFESIHSELEWLSALRRDTKLQVPDPMTSTKGELVVIAEADQVPEPRNVVLFRWMNGELKRDALTFDDMKQVGEAMARLHQHSKAWPRPYGFERHSVDHTGIYAPETNSALESPHSWLTEDQRLHVLEIAQQSREMMADLGFGDDVHGLIHADLHRGNFLFEGDQLQIIDFDDCGFAHYCYDFAACLAFMYRSEEYTKFRGALFEGYERVHPLPPGTCDLLGAFLRLRYYALVRWMIERGAENPKLREEGPKYVEFFLAQLDRTYELDPGATR